jgi:hypothetical protein
MDLSTYSIVFLLIGYFFLTYLSIDIFKYFDRLKEVFTSTSNYLFNTSFDILGRNKKHIDYIKNENQKSFNARRDFYIFLVLSIFLFSANVFVLSTFFGEVSGLDESIFGPFSDLGFLQYSHMVAAVIILFEVGLGILYFYFEYGQEQDPDEANYTGRLYAISIIVGICVLVEGFIWYQLSSILNEQGILRMPEGTSFVVTEVLKGFLGFFGAAFTLGEYYYGYSISKAQNEIDESVIIKIISIIFFTFVSLWTFLASGVLYIFHVIVWFLRLLLEFIILPSKFLLKSARLFNE